MLGSRAEPRSRGRKDDAVERDAVLRYIRLGFFGGYLLLPRTAAAECSGAGSDP